MSLGIFILAHKVTLERAGKAAASAVSDYRTVLEAQLLAPQEPGWVFRWDGLP